jgi:hypothetical protein
MQQLNAVTAHYGEQQSTVIVTAILEFCERHKPAE